jgi:hypothetical protein
MTKEEILDKHGRLISGPALAAMDEYAKQRAIAYGNFINKNNLYKPYELWYKNGHPEWGVKTDEEVYDLFEQSIK